MTSGRIKCIIDLSKGESREGRMINMGYKFFTGEYTTIQEVKNAYRKLAFQYHPDRGGNVEDMQALNNEYDKLIREVNDKQERKVNINEGLENNFKKVIFELLKLDNLTINIVGWYIWVSGDTKPYKEKLKELGLFWSSNQKQWYYNGSTKKARTCSRKSWEEITSFFGCMEVTKKEEKEEKKQLQQVG